MTLSKKQIEQAERNRKYWKDREEEALKHYTKNEQEYQKRLNEIYQSTLDNCQKEIDSFFGKYAAKEGITIAEAKKRVSQLDIKAYERKAEKYVKDKDFSAKANEEMRLYNLTMKVNRLEMLKANIGLELIAGHDELDKYMSGILKGRTMEELQRQAGILGKTVSNAAQKANAIVNASFRNANFSDRIWMYQDELKNDIGKLLTSGLIQGKNPRTLAKDLKARFGVSTSNAERLMRTELARVQTEAQKQSYQRNGWGKYEFIVNRGCCPICEALDGKHFSVDKMQAGFNAPPMHPNCRCATAPWEDSEEYDAWLDYLDKGGTTEKWEATDKAIWKSQRRHDKKSAAAPTKAAQPKKEEIKDISGTSDFETLEKYLSSTYNIGVEESVKALNFGTVKEALIGVENIIKEFPQLKGSLKKITTDKRGVMSCDGSSITFNPKYFTDDGKILKDACVNSSNSGWWPKNSSISSIGVHETGHAIENLLINANKTYQYSWERVEAWNKCTEAKGIVSQSCKNIKKTEYGKGKKNAELIGAVSKYASSNASETMAEAFADVFNNGENANPLSIEIHRLTIEQLKTYEGSGNS